jgi:4-nitrophenyl phosphatase
MRTGMHPVRPSRFIDHAAIEAMDPRALLFDLDGTLLLDDSAVAGAASLLGSYRGRCAVITNNSTELPETIARRLAAQGLDLPAASIFTAGMLLVDEIVRFSRQGGRVLALLSPELTAVARARGAALSTDAGMVAVGRFTRFGYRDLMTAANLVRRGAVLVASNLDASHPATPGAVVPETGALVAAIQAASGSRAVINLGKPAPTLALRAIGQLDCPPTAVAVIGDNPDTDGGIARAIGAAFVAVTVCRDQ